MKLLPVFVSGDISLMDGAHLFVRHAGTTHCMGLAGYTFPPLLAGAPEPFTFGVMPVQAGTTTIIDLTFQSDTSAVFFGARERFPCAYGSKAGYFEELDEHYDIRITIVTGDSAASSGFTWSVVRRTR